MPKVSIILPVYKVEAYIQDCIQSIVGQTFSDFELIIVDDGSPDESISIAEKTLIDSSVKFKIIKRDNGGLSAARNTGIKNSCGDFLVFVDSDDVLSDSFLETLYSDAINNEVELSIGNFRKVSDADKWTFDDAPSASYVVDKDVFLKQIIRHETIPYFGCFLISRNLFDKFNLAFDEFVYFGVDQCIMWRLMVLTEKYTYNPKEIYNYYLRPNSIMTGQKLEKMLSNLPAFERCARDLSLNPYFDSSYIVTRQKVAALHTIATRFSYDDYKLAYKRLNPSFYKMMLFPDIRVKLIALASVAKRIQYDILKRS